MVEPAGSSVPFGVVAGRCPACGYESLALGDEARVTCTWVRCPAPWAADELLDAPPAYAVRKPETEAPGG